MSETIGERLKTLEPGHWLLIVAPRFEHVITGTDLVGVMQDGTVKLRYTDGSVEARRASESVLSMPADDPKLIELVEFVQAGRQAVQS